MKIKAILAFIMTTTVMEDITLVFIKIEKMFVRMLTMLENDLSSEISTLATSV